MGYREHINNLSLDQITRNWLIHEIREDFNNNETITPLIILSKIGVPIKDQVKQLEKKAYVLRIKNLLKELCADGYLTIKKHLHDSLGIKEVSYIKSEILLEKY